MPVDFPGLLAAPLQRAFGEAWTWHPRCRPNGPNSESVADLDRAEVDDVSGIFDELADDFEAGSGNAYDARTDQRVRHHSAKWTVTISLSALPYAPQVGDRVTRKKTGEVYTAGPPARADTTGDAVIPLGKAR